MIRKRLRRLSYIAGYTTDAIISNPLGSILTIISCWFAIAALSGAAYLMDNAKRFAESNAASEYLIAYIEGTQHISTINTIKEKISSLNEVSDVIFIPRQKGFERIKEWLGKDNPALIGLAPEILPDAFQVKLKDTSSDYIEDIAKKISKMPEINDVRFSKGLIRYLARGRHLMKTVGDMVSVIAILSLCIIIFSSIRSHMLLKREEIKTIELIGADTYFIYAPYIIEGITFCIAGVTCTFIAMSMFIHSLMIDVPKFMAFVEPFTLKEGLEITIISCICGISGSILAVRECAHE